MNKHKANVKIEAISANRQEYISKGRKIFKKKRKIFNKMQNWKIFQQMQKICQQKIEEFSTNGR